MSPYPTRSTPKCLETPLQDIERCIPITIQHQPARRTGVGARAQGLLDQLAAVGIHLGRVAGSTRITVRPASSALLTILLINCVHATSMMLLRIPRPVPVPMFCGARSSN